MHISRISRTGLALLLTGCVALAGCSSKTSVTADAAGATTPATASSSTPTPTAEPTGPVTTDATLDKIVVDGAKGTAPKVTVPAPWAIASTQTKVLDEGTGPVVPIDATVLVQYSGVNGRTGKVFDSSYVRGAGGVAFPLSPGSVVTGFSKGIVGQKVGSRIVIAMTGADGYDSAGGQPSADIKVGDTLIFVVEILDAQQETVYGTPVTPKEGLPQVSSDPTNPKVTVTPGYPAPAETVVQPLIQSPSTQQVAATDTVTVRFSMYSAKTGQQIATNWDAAKPESGKLSSLLPGWRTGLVNQTVGSRVLLIVPPKDGYPEGNPALKIEAGDTLICVVDILWTQKLG